MADTLQSLTNEINSIIDQINVIDNILNSNIEGGEINNLPRVNFLLDHSFAFGNSIIRQDNTCLIYINKISVSNTSGLKGVLNYLLQKYNHYNSLYQTKKSSPLKRVNDSITGRENVSKSDLRQSQEFFLTAYNKLLNGEYASLMNTKKMLNDSLIELEKRLSNFGSTTQVQLTISENLSDIAENEKDIATFNAETKKALSSIYLRNLAIYILPAIALIVVGYFIYKRKIKL